MGRDEDACRKVGRQVLQDRPKHLSASAEPPMATMSLCCWSIVRLPLLDLYALWWVISTLDNPLV
ncbi:hypothetical protein ACEPPZ_20905, partial [Paracoccus yeei]|uniref:hypothetical protein n=1 Tax=Paracoccus yeei TaxID=147645 RepID=UPI0037D4AB91